MKKCFFSKLCGKLKSKKTVNVINLDGVIGNSGMKQGLSISSLHKIIEKAFEDKKTELVALNINSPGGSPVQSELIAKRVKQLSKKKNIPVIAFVEDIAASGGYWIASAAEKIIVAENSILGSLGVRFSGFGFVKAIENIGVERRVHTKGENKALLDPFLPEKQEDIEMILEVQQDIYENFKKQVHNGRDGKLKISDQELFSGKIWSGKQSIAIGLADEIGDLNSYLENIYGDDLEIKFINQEKSWLKRKLGLSFSNILQTIISELIHSSKIELK